MRLQAVAAQLAVSMIFSVSIVGWSSKTQGSDSIGAVASAYSGVNECFHEPDRMRRLVMDQSSVLARLMREVGQERYNKDHVRLLTDEQDLSVCRQLNEIHSEIILATQSHRGPAYASDAPNYEVAYYQIAEYYVVAVADASPVSARDDIDIFTTGRRRYFAVYSSDLAILRSSLPR